MTFAQDCRALRRARGLTQRQLAKQLAVTAQTVNNWEKGRNAPWPHKQRRMLILVSGEGYLSGEGLGEPGSREAPKGTFATIAGSGERRRILADCLGE